MRLFAAIMLLALCGCTFRSGSLDRASERKSENAASLSEESRALTTGALDALSYAPTNPPTALAKVLLKKDQQIEGVPVHRLDVEAILAGQRQALSELTNRLSSIDSLMVERARLEERVSQLNAELAEMGRKYEQERNRGVLRRVFSWLGIGGSFAALAALFIFFPPAIMIAGRLLGWIVSRLPGAASWVGVVSIKAFDQVVAGVEKAKKAIGSENTLKLEAELGREMDKPHKTVVRLRKATLPQT